MVPLAFGVLWVAYGVGMTGWVLIKGYDVPLREIWAPVNYYTGKWPPQPIPSTQVFPASAKKASKSGGPGAA